MSRTNLRHRLNLAKSVSSMGTGIGKQDSSPGPVEHPSVPHFTSITVCSPKTNTALIILIRRLFILTSRWLGVMANEGPTHRRKERFLTFSNLEKSRFHVLIFKHIFYFIVGQND